MTRYLLAVMALACTFGAQATDLEAGKKKAAEVCAACHGADGNSATADFPRIAGQHADYLAKAMRDYKTGARKDPIMAGFANALSAADIENLSAYFAAQRGPRWARVAPRRDGRSKVGSRPGRAGRSWRAQTARSGE